MRRPRGEQSDSVGANKIAMRRSTTTKATECDPVRQPLLHHALTTCEALIGPTTAKLPRQAIRARRSSDCVSADGSDDGHCSLLVDLALPRVVHARIPPSTLWLRLPPSVHRLVIEAWETEVVKQSC